ncbi:MAG: NAD(P)H-hydrate dehydratase [Myxococcota bacterium]|nr:NAD(P)H-hydrate dehydratase [Myxococcota bacterium]
MKLLVTAAQMAQLERASAQQQDSTGELMERAGAALAEEAQRLASGTGRFLILCGRGNNGGDGLVAARRLLALDREVHCELLPGDDAQLPTEAFNALQGCGFVPAPIPAELTVGAGDVVIDALLGTGLSRAPGGEYARAIERIGRWRQGGARVLAADLPSGLQADTGKAFVPCVEADVTVTFGYEKVGLAMEPGATLAGAVKVADLGLPRAGGASGARTLGLEESDARERLAPRNSDTHKGTYGHLLVVAGSPGKTGAAALTAWAALRSGVGLVTVASRPEAQEAVLVQAPEVMGAPLAGTSALGLDDLQRLLELAEGKSALVIGPGIARGEDTAKLLRALFDRLALPMVLDADALNAIGSDLALLDNTLAPLVLTPHPGEMARLLGRSTQEIQTDRLGAARALSVGQGVVTVLKGARTVIAAPDGTAWINPTGNPGMASAGMGDALSGMIGALLAQGLAPLDAALAATYAHGLAGDLAARRTGQLGLIASELIASLGEVWTRWGR